MPWELRMPRLDEDMQEGTVLKWRKKEGEPVQNGEPVVDIETQKVNYEIEAPGSGILRLILVKEEVVVPINTLLGVIAEAHEDISTYQKPDREKGKTPVPGISTAAPASIPTPSLEEEKRILISPLARKLAQEMGLDITRIKGTGPGGRITKEDVQNYKAPAPEIPKAAGRRIKQTIPYVGMRKTIGDRLSESWRTAPRAENHMTADVTELVKIRELQGPLWENQYGVRPSVNDFVIAAAARALKEFPLVNASLRGGQIEVYEDINISVAVALERGLITPVVRQADRRDLLDIAREVQRLSDLVRKGEHTAETLSGSTFTVTNLGMFDVEVFVPILNPPEAAILSVGKIERKPVVIQDTIAVRSVMQLCVAYDHRVLDGAVAARFLQFIKKALENGVSLLPGESKVDRARDGNRA